MTTKLLIKNGTIVTFGSPCEVLFNHSILIEDGIIKKIDRDDAFNGITIDNSICANGKIVMPGLINTHMHFYSTLVRGLSKVKPSTNFVEILNNLWWRLDKLLTMDDIYYSTLIMLLTAIRCGTTTFIDHHASPYAISGSLQKIAQAIKEIGTRGCLCYEVSDRDGKKISDEGIIENLNFIKFCKENHDDQIKALFGLHASFTLTDETLNKASYIASDLDTGFHVHTAEAVSDQEATFKKYNKRVVERFYSHGILGSKTIAAHCVHLSDHEMDLLAKTDTMVVHNPQSNMNNAVGIANIIEMQRKGICIGLGTDAMTVDMFEELRCAMWTQHLNANNPSVGFKEVTDTLFVNNSLIVNRIWNGTKIGLIKEGYVGDLIIVDYNPPTVFDNETILGHLLFGFSQQAKVDTTIVGGKILMQNKELKINIDELMIYNKSKELSKKLWSKF